MTKIPAQLHQAAHDVHESGRARSVTVRDLLKWFDADKRGLLVASEIRAALTRVKLRTIPDFEVAYIEQKLTLEPVGVAARESRPPNRISRAPGLRKKDVLISDATAAPSVPDLTLRIGMLAAANRPPKSVKPDDAIETATTAMRIGNYSQLPVMPSVYRVDGLISWKSIYQNTHDGKSCRSVRECMERETLVISTDTHLLEAARMINEKDLVLVKNHENKITGLVTTMDISVELGSLSQPFLLLLEIENYVRVLIDGKFTAEELRNVRDPKDSTRQIESVLNLALGEKIRLLDNPTNWARLGLRLDRKQCAERLREVNRIRNSVMHFNPDGPYAEDMQVLRETRRFLQSL